MGKKWTSYATLKERMEALGEEIRALHEGAPRRAALQAEWDGVVAQLRDLQRRDHELRDAALNPHGARTAPISAARNRTRGAR